MSRSKHFSKGTLAKAVLAVVVSGTAAAAGAVTANYENTYSGSAKYIGKGQTWEQTDNSLKTGITAYQYQGNSIQLNQLGFSSVTGTDKNGNSTHTLHVNMGGYVYDEKLQRQVNHNFADFVFRDYNTVSKSLDSSVKDGVIMTTLTDSEGNTLESTADISEYVGETVRETAKDGKMTLNNEETTIEKAIETVSKEAAKHASVAAGDANVKVDGTAVNANGGTEYKVSLADDIKVKSVTADTGTIGGVAMQDGTITTGDTTISGTSVKVGDSELKTDSLKVNGKAYITSDGISANSQKITNVAAGTLAADSADAVNGSQLYATNQQVQANSESITNLWKKAGDLNKKINRTGANAAALAALHPLDFDEDHKVSASAGIGQYHGTGALAVGVFIRPTENLMFNLGGAFASSDRMFNAGVSYRFGDNSAKPVATNAQMAERVNSLTAENRDLTAQLKASGTKLESVAAENAELRAEIKAIKARLGMK